MNDLPTFIVSNITHIVNKDLICLHATYYLTMNRRMDERSEHIDEKLGQMNARIDQVHEAMRVQTRWTVGTIALFGTIVTVLLAIAQFTAG